MLFAALLMCETRGVIVDSGVCLFVCSGVLRLGYVSECDLRKGMGQAVVVQEEHLFAFIRYVVQL